jgi:hypothetical protein
MLVAVLDDYLYIDGGEISQFVNGEADSVASRPGTWSLPFQDTIHTHQVRLQQ